MATGTVSVPLPYPPLTLALWGSCLRPFRPLPFAIGSSHTLGIWVLVCCFPWLGVLWEEDECWKSLRIVGNLLLYQGVEGFSVLVGFLVLS